MPFGEELYEGIGDRTGDAGLKYSSSEDDVRQKFTGYQKDNETNLDFAEARMYASELGRFTAVDPLLASGRSANPQTFNRYVYVVNNPINLTDPTGLDPCASAGNGADHCNSDPPLGSQHQTTDDKYVEARFQLVLTYQGNNAQRINDRGDQVEYRVGSGIETELRVYDPDDPNNSNLLTNYAASIDFIIEHDGVAPIPSSDDLEFRDNGAAGLPVFFLLAPRLTDSAGSRAGIPSMEDPIDRPDSARISGTITLVSGDAKTNIKFTASINRSEHGVTSGMIEPDLFTRNTVRILRP